MSSDPGANEIQSQEAFMALQAGNYKKACEAFEDISASGQADATAYLGLAHARSELGDLAGAFTAVDKSLEMSPGNLRALLFKADHLEQGGESRQVLEYYQHALGLAGNTADIPKDVAQGLQRAKQACEKKDQEYQSFLKEKLKSQGFTAGPLNRRFQQSLDLIFESKEVFYQEPRRYYSPGLPQIQFYERDQFEWLPSLEAATQAIRNELTTVMANPSLFSPYLEADSNHLNQYDASLLNSKDWGALYLWEHGHLVSENASLFPQTLKALEAVPLPVITEQAPMALFSKLTPGTLFPRTTVS